MRYMHPVYSKPSPEIPCNKLTHWVSSFPQTLVAGHTGEKSGKGFLRNERNEKESIKSSLTFLTLSSIEVWEK